MLTTIIMVMVVVVVMTVRCDDDSGDNDSDGGSSSGGAGSEGCGSKKRRHPPEAPPVLSGLSGMHSLPSLTTCHHAVHHLIPRLYIHVFSSFNLSTHQRLTTLLPPQLLLI